MSATTDIPTLRWGTVAQTLIRHRDELLWLALPSDDNGVRDNQEQKDCYHRAARALGPAIAEAVKHRQSVEESFAAPKPPPVEPISERDFHELGRQAQGKSIQDMGNLEALACVNYANDELRKKRDREGCCGGEPMADGVCYGIGLCPRVAEAARAEAFIHGFMEWLDQIQDESALAAVAARLSVAPSLEIGVDNVGICISNG